MRRRPVIAIALVGLGLILAPVAFQMFTRAPKGGEMITDFEPFMTEQRLDAFDGYLVAIDRAHAETSGRAPGSLRDLEEGETTEPFDERFPSLAVFNEQWPAIFEDMSGMLATIRDNLDNFAAVKALPPFWLFPWFFVFPGAIVVFAARSSLKSARYTYPRKRLWFLVVMGIGIVAAPAIFQMFTRAPLGAEMIDDFEPMMTEQRVTTIQTYFVTIAQGEGEIRVKLKPAVEEAGGDFASDFGDAEAFIGDWPRISGGMAPMVGAMADNLDNYAAVKALPPFWLFPWFFVFPGVIVAVLALVAMQRRPKPAESGSGSEPARERGGVA